jgi:hypothetical protein
VYIRRALELVAGVEDDHVLARRGQFVAQRVDRGGHARHAAEAFARRVILGRQVESKRLIGWMRL